MTHRLVEPELLDHLPPDHPDAWASRGDIRFLNSLMGSFRWLRNQLSLHTTPQDRIVELGAGDAGLLHYVADQHPRLAKQWTGLDLVPPPTTGLPHGASWVQGNFFEQSAAAEALGNATIVVANLILHHFEAEQLRALGRQMSGARVILINEPARHVQHLWKGRLVDAVIGFNYVTMYDMACSIRAGFRTGELPGLLGLSSSDWTLRQSSTTLGACRLTAIKK